ncbi:signal recognition particle-docking protein FtsY, partial [Methylobacterium sp. WL6]
MSQDEKPGWFGRLFGRKGATEAPEPPADSPASPAEGQPDFATGADDVAH